MFLPLPLTMLPPRTACMPAESVSPASPVTAIVMFPLLVAVVLASACMPTMPPLPAASVSGASGSTAPSSSLGCKEKVSEMSPLLVSVALSSFAADLSPSIKARSSQLLIPHRLMPPALSEEPLSSILPLLTALLTKSA